MAEFGVRDVERLLRMSRSTIQGLVRAGFVDPARGARGEYRFSFQDLILLRTARALSAANVPARRITRSLKALRSRLPEAVPLSGLRICAVGDRVVVAEKRGRWRADSGQYLLDLDVAVADGEPSIQPSERGGEAGAEAWFDHGLALEPQDFEGARESYARALALDPGHRAARINLGRLLHEAGRLREAERVYREGPERAGNDGAALLFNLGVLLEDLGRREEAIAAYESALGADPRFADCHYNLALAYEAAGNARAAIRHMGEYRKLARR